MQLYEQLCLPLDFIIKSVFKNYFNKTERMIPHNDLCPKFSTD